MATGDTSTSAVPLRVNGREETVAADPDTPLLYVLRNDLGLKGARFGCGRGQCGACTVLIDGAPATSCDTPLSAAAGRSVETVESLAGSPLLTAFLDEQAAQCGYCLPGILMRAKALLARAPSPGREAIAAALDVSLCRCGAHVRILRAVERAAAEGRP